MKKISTVNMDATKKKKLLGNMLGSFGNLNIRWHHIEYFAKKILSENEERCNNIAAAPNYYAWLCLITEYIFGLMRHFCFLHEGLKDNNLTLEYNGIAEVFYDQCKKLNLYKKAELEELVSLILKTLYLRHSLIHNGFPTLLPATLESFRKRNKPLLSNTKFNEDEAREIISWYSNPSNFKLAEEEFMKIIVAACPKQEISIGLGG